MSYEDLILYIFADFGTTDVSFILICSCLVFIMTPGLAFFYGGLLRKKNIISMMAMCFTSIVAVGLFWFILGYSLAFAPDIGGGILGGLDFIGMLNIDTWYYPVYSTTIPHMLYVIFQMMFAIITVAIVASPFADRAKFSSFLIFSILWLLLVYSPIAHWVWGDGGFLKTWGILDFAGGSVVHINAGFSALAVALVIGARKGYNKEPMEPSNIPYVILGTALLWIGWFGFNGGSALEAGPTATLAIFNTFMSSCAAGFVWLLIGWYKTGKASMLGLVTGVLAGLVGVTPAAGFVTPMSAIIIGMVAGIICYKAMLFRMNIGLDESLDAWAIHGIGGLWGALATGIFATQAVGGYSGLLYGNASQFIVQIIGAGAAIIYAFILTFLIAKIVDIMIGLRVTEEEEYVGVDISQHGERAYNG